MVWGVLAIVRFEFSFPYKFLTMYTIIAIQLSINSKHVLIVPVLFFPLSFAAVCVVWHPYNILIIGWFESVEFKQPLRTGLYAEHTNWIRQDKNDALNQLLRCVNSFRLRKIGQAADEIVFQKMQHSTWCGVLRTIRFRSKYGGIWILRVMWCTFQSRCSTLWYSLFHSLYNHFWSQHHSFISYSTRHETVLLFEHRT